MKLIFAALVLVGLFACDIALEAQVPGVGHPAEKKGGRAMPFASIAARIGLTPEQEAKAKPVVEELNLKLADLREDTSFQPNERVAEVRKVHDETDAKLKDILSSGQFAQWEKISSTKEFGSTRIAF